MVAIQPEVLVSPDQTQFYVNTKPYFVYPYWEKPPKDWKKVNCVEKKKCVCKSRRLRHIYYRGFF